MGIIDKWLQGEIREVPLEAVHRAMPQESVKEGERIVGTLSQEFRKVWALSLAYAERALYLQENKGDTSDLRRAMATAETLKKLAWWLLRKEYDLWGDDEKAIGVRKGWEAVVCPQCYCTVCIFNRWAQAAEAKIARLEAEIAGSS